MVVLTSGEVSGTFSPAEFVFKGWWSVTIAKIPAVFPFTATESPASAPTTSPASAASGRRLIPFPLPFESTVGTITIIPAVKGAVNYA